MTQPSPTTAGPAAPTGHRLADLHREGPFPLPAADWGEARPDVAARWLAALGELPGATEPTFGVIDEVAEANHRRLRISYRTSDGDDVPAFLLVPRGEGPFPAVLALHPTVPEGKADVATSHGRDGRRYGLELAERGYVVLAPDTITAGDRIADGEQPYHTASFMAARPEVSPVGKIVADHRQGVSVLASLPFVAADRIGVIGHSLGGYNAWFLASVDDRVRAVVSSCGYATFAGDPHPHHWGKRDWFSHFPELSKDFDRGTVPFEFHEIVALVAPRPLFTWATTSDQFFPNWIESMRGLDEVYRVYTELGHPDAMVTWLGHGPHDFPDHVREAAYAFLDSNLGSVAPT